jgi:hypothetical protein
MSGDITDIEDGSIIRTKGVVSPDNTEIEETIQHWDPVAAEWVNEKKVIHKKPIIDKP